MHTNARIDHARIVAEARRLRQQEIDRLLRSASHAAIRLWRALTGYPAAPINHSA